MNADKLLELMMYAVPSLIVGAVAYYMFQSHFKDQQNTRKWLLLREKQKHSLPLKLQAYERLALFLERINPSKLLIRVAPADESKEDYQNLLIRHIEQEYEHNLTQQIYITDDAWVMILNAKNAIIQTIRKVTLEPGVTNADQLREKLLSNLFEGESPSTVALMFLKTEVAQVLG